MFMSKLAPTSTKYVIRASLKANGVVEKPDIIGAVFGQTEGLLGTELDLRELQRTGRIGRIDVRIKSTKGKSTGEILIPSSLDAAETSLIAATLETIERVGPCTAKIKLEEVEDTRSDKRKFVIDKAKEILKNLSEQGVPDSSGISDEIKEAVRTEEVRNVFGLAAGPSVLESEDIVIVEGRADVINLLKFGIRNTIAIEGTSAPKAVIELSKKKECTLFVDGDRGGQLIAKKLLQITELDYITMAPEGKEVEELTQKEAYKALREKVPPNIFFSEGTRRIKLSALKEHKVKAELKVSAPAKSTEKRTPTRTVSSATGTRSAPERRDSRSRSSGRSFDRDAPVRRDSRSRSFDRDAPVRRDSRSRSSGRSFDRRDSRSRSPPRIRIGSAERELFKKTLDELVGTRAACIFNSKDELMGRVPVAELENTLKTLENPHAVIFDGKASYRLGEVCKRKGVRFLVGMDKEDFHSPVAVLSKTDLNK